MAAVAVAQSESLTISRSESQAIVTVLSISIAVTTFCAIATVHDIPTGRLVSTESRRGPAYDLPVAKPVAKDEVVQVAVPVYDHYAFQQLETGARTQDFVYLSHKAASAAV